MSNKKKEIKQSENEPRGIPIPAGTEQETGFTRGETEKVNGPVKLSAPIPESTEFDAFQR